MTAIAGWSGNRADSPVEYEVESLAQQYLDSGWDEAREGWPIERKVYAWLSMDSHTDSDGKVYAGKNLAWDPDEQRAGIDALVDLIIEKRRARDASQ